MYKHTKTLFNLFNCYSVIRLSTLLKKLSSDSFHIKWSFSFLDNVNDVINLNTECHSERFNDFSQNFSITFNVSLLCGLELTQESTDLGFKISVWISSCDYSKLAWWNGGGWTYP